MNGNVVVCGLFDVFPFFVLLHFIEGKGEHSVYGKSVGCKFMLEGVVGEEINCGVCRSRIEKHQTDRTQ